MECLCMRSMHTALLSNICTTVQILHETIQQTIPTLKRRVLCGTQHCVLCAFYFTLDRLRLSLEYESRIINLVKKKVLHFTKHIYVHV